MRGDDLGKTALPDWPHPCGHDVSLTLVRTWKRASVRRMDAARHHRKLSLTCRRARSGALALASLLQAMRRRCCCRRFMLRQRVT